MKKFLVINPFGIGDVLFTTPVVRAIKNSSQCAFLGYWCNERVRPILENNPHIDKIFALSRGDIKRIYSGSKLNGIGKLIRLVWDIKKENFDVSLDFSLDHRYGLISKLAGIKKRIGFNYKKRGRFLTDKIDIEGYKDRHVAEYYLGLLKFINISASARDLELFITEEQKNQAGIYLEKLGITGDELVIGIAAGAGLSWGKDAWLKHWPAENFAQVADKIINQNHAKVLLLGDERERSIADAILRAMGNKPIDLVGKTDLANLSAILSRLKLLLTNDGGPLHMAVASGIKTVSIFGPVDEKVYGPYPGSEKNIVLNEDIECRPCYNNFRLAECLNNHRCIKEITVDEVYSSVMKLIGD